MTIAQQPLRHEPSRFVSRNIPELIVPIYFLPYKIVRTQRNEGNDGHSAYSNLDTEALRLVALCRRLAFLPVIDD